MNKTAHFSPCRQYRYVLTRNWDITLPVVMFIGLNPSTADEYDDDRTISKCIRYAKRWGYGGIIMCNLFAYRTKDPHIMKAAYDPIGNPINDDWIRAYAKSCPVIVAVWGVDGGFCARSIDMQKMFVGRLSYLRLTKNGEPSHPLYLPARLDPVSFDTP